jgi:hypothetical protein
MSAPLALETASTRALLRLARAWLYRQLRLLEEQRLDEALALGAQLEGLLGELEIREVRPAPAGSSAAALSADLAAECAALNEAILPYLLREQGLLGRELLELEVDRELSRLRVVGAALHGSAARTDNCA